jgi:predicted ATP-dependent endonuclease of OLD family
MRVDCRICDEPVFFAFGETTTKQINDASTSPRVPDELGTLFFPPKEVLTHRKAMAASRERGEEDGFGDTYYDLVKALGHSTTRGPIQNNLRTVMNRLEALFAGKVKQEDDEFVFQRGPKKFSMSQTAEGIKKIGLITHLIRNRHIQSDSILFFDEPAAHLHPDATMAFMKMLFEMTNAGIQIFIATHSYTVLKQLELLARENGSSIPLCMLRRRDDQIETQFADLKDRLPSNSIVQASVDLFERDLQIGAGG